MYAPGALWTAAHHRMPLLSVMHNNRAYHQEPMHLQRMANRQPRASSARTSAPRSTIRHRLRDAREDGHVGQGPINNVNDLGPAIGRAVDVVKRGQPALLDVVTQPR